LQWLWQSLWVSWTGVFLAAYLIGGIPTAYLAARWIKGADIRQLGDLNAGAANVYRNVGHKAGIAVGAVDIAKGAAAVILAKTILDSTTAGMISGGLVIAGHNWPVYLQFRGGRGAATGVGVLLATIPLLAIPLGLVCLAVLYLTKRATVSLAVFLILAPLLAWWPMDYTYALAGYSLFIPLLVGVSHYLSIKFLASAGDGVELPLPQS
jgi:glycerol-3-phosphate acyltransferase PlsY